MDVHKCLYQWMPTTTGIIYHEFLNYGQTRFKTNFSENNPLLSIRKLFSSKQRASTYGESDSKQIE